VFKEVGNGKDFPEMERRVLDFWEKECIFEKLRDKNCGRKPWSFIDGPMTANNPMGVHHAWGRTYKDIFQRFKAMQGFDERYQNGFDCQGLWVEVEVEKDLGLDSKREILEYGLDKFSRKCRERVEKYSALQTNQSKRLGQWMDWEHSYYTMSDTNIEYIWHFLKVCSEKGWLYKGSRVMPWCARCGTSLSQHELIDSYRDLTHTSVFIQLPLLDKSGEYILVWTTTPWTLAANTALAVRPDLGYAKVRQDDKILYLSAGTLSRLKPDYEVLGTVKGSELVGLRYQGPFYDLLAQQKLDTRVVAWTDVGEEEGTGVVHIAPGCGEEDYNLSKEHGLPVLVPIDENGVYYPDYGPFAGKQVGDVAKMVFDDLAQKGMLYKTEDYDHRYPVCWRCGEELVFRLVDEWFISCDEIREPMIREARKVHWVPDYAGKRMEDWLNNMGDWCISRKRFWGLPLPFFKCSCGEATIIGSRKELEELAIREGEVSAEQLNLPELHRPWIDNVKIRCPKCGGLAERVPEVGDCWLDAGIVPFSTMGFLDKDNAYWQKWFPAKFVCEMREQIRLWFYAMMFMSVTLTGRSPYRAALVYEKVHDEKGRPMHKSWGNAIWFGDAVEKMGADVMRWIYASANIQNNLNFGYGIGHEVVRKLLTLWNTYSFFVMYANVDNWTPDYGLPDLQTSPLDRWILSHLHSLIGEVTSSLESFDAARMTQVVEAFIDDLSNWYVRLSRRRFWRSESDDDKQSAYATLYKVLVTLAKLIAPVLPFTAEEMYQNLMRSVDSNAPESVHLCDWPVQDKSLIDKKLMAENEAVMKVVQMGRSARNAAGIKVRQPLAALYVETPEWKAVKRNEKLILDELNVKSLQEFSGSSDGMEIVEEGGVSVALDISLTDDLVQEGLVRDLVRRIQTLRKESGFNVDDRIIVYYESHEPLLTSISTYSDYIKQETLADDLVAAIPGDSFILAKIGGEQIKLMLKRS
jgi:isoleucyl-tRNA synthetase